MEFTGERYVPQVHGDIELEHVHRYLLARTVADNKIVLDIACGEGYGSAILARTAARVIGVDLSREAIMHARTAYPVENIEFLVGDCTEIPLEDESVDLVISFETLEHVANHDAMLAEIRRVLRPEGMVLISSPDKYAYSVEPGYKNPYHVKELFDYEFKRLVRTHFEHCQFLGQRIVYGSAILNESVPEGLACFWREGEAVKHRAVLPRPLYWLAFASNSSVPVLKSGLFEQPISEAQLVRELENACAVRDQTVTDLSRSVDQQTLRICELEGLITSLQNTVSEMSSSLSSVETQLGQKGSETCSLSKELAGLKALLLSKTHELEQALAKSESLKQEIDVKTSEIESQKTRLSEMKSSIGEKDESIRSLQFFKEELTRLRATRIVMMRDLLKFEPWSVTKISNLLRLSLSFLVPKYRKDFEDSFSTFVLSHDGIPAGTHGSHEIDAPFDRDFYMSLYPDVLSSGMDPYLHYIRHGMSEGRIGSLPKLPEIQSEGRFDPLKQTVLIVSHEGSRTGAPIVSYNIILELLGRYNVISLFLGSGGPIMEASASAGAIVAGPLPGHWRGALSEIYVRRITESFPIHFAIVNSIESRFVLWGLARSFVPTITLIHEFAAYTRPHGAFYDAVIWSGEVIFSSRITQANAFEEYELLRHKNFRVIPQGQCVVPFVYETAHMSKDGTGNLADLIRPQHFPAKGIVVLGLGYVQYRKGVDLFLECASRVLGHAPDLDVRFVWIGKGYDPQSDAAYSGFLHDQINRSGIENHVVILDEVPNLEMAYSSSDILFLSSRLDPLPNVAIDALAQGLPVICFEDTTGIADILSNQGLREECVCSYLDTEEASRKVIALAQDKSLRDAVGLAAKRIADEIFDMDEYTKCLEGLALEQREQVAREKADCETILSSGLTRNDYFFLPEYSNQMLEVDAVREYVRRWKTGVGVRKLFPGFHPGIYSERNGVVTGGSDPLADYIRRGMPQGAWNFRVITSSTEIDHASVLCRVGLHIHVYYSERFFEIYEALVQNKIRPDLFISVSNEETVAEIGKCLESYRGGEVTIRRVPNRGRDIGPFIIEFLKEIGTKYDIVGHVHTKNSVHINDKRTVNNWSNFLIRNLIASDGPMADIIINTICSNKNIGIVFPDDPNVYGWSDNLEYAKMLGPLIDITDFRENFVFPMGSMFWARTSSLAPLLELGLGWDDMPEEPAPKDGSILHALERLIPFVVTKSGLEIVLTNVKGVTR